MPLNHPVFQEGEAAGFLGQDRDRNPYRREIERIARDTGKDADSRLYELASDWRSGWVKGRNRPDCPDPRGE